MLEIALTVCSILSAQSCKDISLTYPDEGQLVTPFACMMIGQSEISKWIEGHPNWSVARWTCQGAGRYAKI